MREPSRVVQLRERQRRGELNAGQEACIEYEGQEAFEVQKYLECGGTFVLRLIIYVSKVSFRFQF
jgi:hypothetical protein